MIRERGESNCVPARPAWLRCCPERSPGMVRSRGLLIGALQVAIRRSRHTIAESRSWLRPPTRLSWRCTPTSVARGRKVSKPACSDQLICVFRPAPENNSGNKLAARGCGATPLELRTLLDAARRLDIKVSSPLRRADGLGWLQWTERTSERFGSLIPGSFKRSSCWFAALISAVL